MVEGKRREHNWLGFALHLVAVRNAGAFLEDPLDVPVVLIGAIHVKIRERQVRDCQENGSVQSSVITRVGWLRAFSGLL